MKKLFSIVLIALFACCVRPDDEDVRFCCLVMMRVPNVLLADVYGIAPSSVAVRKQRMKKKLESEVENQTIENYLNQYVL